METESRRENPHPFPRKEPRTLVHARNRLLAEAADLVEFLIV